MQKRQETFAIEVEVVVVAIGCLPSLPGIWDASMSYDTATGGRTASVRGTTVCSVRESS